MAKKKNPLEWVVTLGGDSSDEHTLAYWIKYTREALEELKLEIGIGELNKLIINYPEALRAINRAMLEIVEGRLDKIADYNMGSDWQLRKASGKETVEVEPDGRRAVNTSNALTYGAASGYLNEENIMPGLVEGVIAGGLRQHTDHPGLRAILELLSTGELSYEVELVPSHYYTMKSGNLADKGYYEKLSTIMIKEFGTGLMDIEPEDADFIFEHMYSVIAKILLAAEMRK